MRAKNQPKQLTRRQQGFVDAFVANGGKQREAALTAGYTEKAAATLAWRMMKIPAINQAIFVATASAFGPHAVAALHRVAKLVDGARSEYVQLEAANSILDRAGFKPPDRMEHKVDHSLTVSIDAGVGPPLVIEHEAAQERGGLKPTQESSLLPLDER